MMIKKYLYTYVMCLLATGAAFAQAPNLGPISGPANICWSPASQNVFSVSATNNPTYYTWSVYPSQGVTIASPGSSVTTITFPNAANNYFISCQAGNASGVSSPVYFFVSVIEKPNVTFSGNTFFCQGSGTNLSASPTISQGSNTIQYSWSPSAGLSTTVGPVTYANPAQTSTYVVSVTNNPCPTFTTSVVVNVYQVNFSFTGNTYVCQGYSTNISATPNLSGSSTLSYNWFPANGLNTTTGQNVVAGPLVTTIYTVTATDGVCSATNAINITVDECVGIMPYAAGGEPGFRVYPNPNNGRFLIWSGESTEGSLLNELGQTVRQLKFIKDEEIEIEGLSSGVYFLVTPRTRLKIVALR